MIATTTRMIGLMAIFGIRTVVTEATTRTTEHQLLERSKSSTILEDRYNVVGFVEARSILPEFAHMEEIWRRVQSKHRMNQLIRSEQQYCQKQFSGNRIRSS